MKTKLIMLLSLASLFIFLSPSYANDPCSFLSSVHAEIETKEGILATIGRIYTQIHELIKTPYFQELNDEDQGIYFTRQSGFFYTLDCSAEDSARRIEKIGMFGVGDTFKPFRKRVFSDEIYYFGLTRSGLMVFVKKHDLRKMKDGKVYFFNRTITPTYFCTNTDQCSGIQKEFNARHHYAMMDLSEFNQSISAGECTQLNVAIFNGRKQLASDGKAVPEYKKARLTYCYESHDNGVFSNSKSKADQAVNNLAITGQYLILSSKALRDKIPFLFTRKDCLTKKKIKKNSVISLGGSIGAGFDLKVVKGATEGGVKVHYEISDEEIFEVNKQYLYQNYSATIHNLKFGGEKQKILNDIVVTQTCNDTSVPTTLNEIRINFDPKENKLISLDIKELDKIARKRFSGVWITASSSSRLKGRTWLIASVEQKMQWEEFIFDRVHRDILAIVPEGSDKKTCYDYVDYFSSLFMATAFEFIPKSKVDKIEILNRF